MTHQLLDVRDLNVTVGGRHVLSDVTLTVARGECLGLVGESGSGKSIACRAITGLLDRIGASASGSVTFDGTDLLTASKDTWRDIRGRRIAFVPQSSLISLDPIMRIGRQIEETIAVLEPDANRRERAVELLESVHMPRIPQVLTSHPHELSGGMRQRVMIALALAGAPDLLIADEPTTALDVTVQRGILELIQELGRRRGLAVILVTHDMSVISAIADSVAVMYAGTVVESGPVSVVTSRPKHRYTEALLAARPSPDARGQQLRPIVGDVPNLTSRPSGCLFAPRCAHATEVCRRDAPSLAESGPRHSVACWNPVETS